MRVLFLLLLLGRLAVADIFVADYYKKQVYAFDSETKELQATVPVGDAPSGVALNSDGTRAYVTNFFDDTMSVINTETYSVITTVNVGTGPGAIAVSPDDAVVYVSIAGQAISVISTATNTVIDTINTTGSPGFIVFDPLNALAYVGCASPNQIEVINTDTRAVIDTISVSISPAQPVLTPDSSKLYVTPVFATDIVEIDTSSRTVTDTITAGLQLYSACISTDGNTLYVSDYKLGNIVLIDTSTNTVTKTISVGGTPYIMTVSSDGSQVIASNFTSGSIASIIDTATQTEIGSLYTQASVFREISQIQKGAITSDGLSLLLPSSATTNLFRVNTLDYSVSAILSITNADPSFYSDVAINSTDTKAYALISQAVYPVDLSDNSFSSAITVGSGPRRLAITTDNAFVYVTNLDGDSVSVIDTSTDTVSTTITSIAGANQIVMNPVIAEAYVLQTDSSDYGIAVIDTSAHSVITTISLTGDPDDLAVDATGSLLYVVDNGASVIRVIDTSTRTIIDTITPASTPNNVAVAPDNSALYVGLGDSVAIYDIPGYTLNTTVTTNVSSFNLVLDSLGSNLYIFNSAKATVFIDIMDTSAKAITATIGRNHAIGVAEYGSTTPSGSAISPINVEGVAKKSGFINQTVLKNEISWFAPYNTTSSTVLRYRVYRDGRAVGVVDAGAPLVYVDRDVRGGVEYTYEIRAEGSSSSNLTSGSVNVRTKKAR